MKAEFGSGIEKPQAVVKKRKVKGLDREGASKKRKPAEADAAAGEGEEAV